MRGRTPTLHCDAEDGMCGNWDVDYYENCASLVGAFRITSDHRAPNWTNNDDEDLCPDHRPIPKG